jgi:nucleotide-binding universal stress UspA family protein
MRWSRLFLSPTPRRRGTNGHVVGGARCLHKLRCRCALLSELLSEDRVKFYEQLQRGAVAEAQKSSVTIRTHLVVGDEVGTIVEFLRQEKMDLLVIGLHKHTPPVARLWNTVFELEQEAPRSVLGVH